MIRRPPRSTQSRSSAASDVYKRQDYEVFLLTRMREAWDETGANLKAVTFGLSRTGRIVTSAALIIVVVGGSFAFTSILVTKAIGVGLAVAVALDASVIRILM